MVEETLLQRRKAPHRIAEHPHRLDSGEILGGIVSNVITSLPLTTMYTATASQQPHLPITSTLQRASGSWSGVVG